MKSSILFLSIIYSLNSFALTESRLGRRPTIPGDYGQVVNCDSGVYRGSDGWARCWLWNELNKAWEQRTVYCPQVGCDYKLPPDDDDRNN